jgi:hypothetical protein
MDRRSARYSIAKTSIGGDLKAMKPISGFHGGILLMLILIMSF